MGEDNCSSSSSDMTSVVDLYSGIEMGVRPISGLLGDLKLHDYRVRITFPLLSATGIMSTLFSPNDIDLTLTVVAKAFLV